MTETNLVPMAGARPAVGHGTSLHDRPGVRHLTSWMLTRGGGLAALLAGLADGLRAYRRWQMLTTMTDGQLARMGIDRRDLPRQAMFGPQGIQPGVSTERT